MGASIVLILHNSVILILHNFVHAEMVDRKNDKSVRDTNPHDLREHFEFAHAIAVDMGNNCPIAEWRS